MDGLVPRAGDLVAGRYRIERPLSSGGFGHLYVARQVALARPVALKLLLPELAEDASMIERFHLEAREACRLAHPNLVVYHDFGEDEDGRPFLVMELIEGRTLYQTMGTTPVFPLARTVHVLVQIAAALEAAHRGGVVHRDLKPGNVMLVRQGTDPDFVKVIDFGILKRLAPRGGDIRTITRTGEIIGTPEYLAPEIIRGEPFDGRADQYAAGVMLYELVAGRRPFQGETLADTLLAHVRADVRPLAEVMRGRTLPPRLEAVVRRALAKEPEDRFPSMAAFATALGDAVRGFVEGSHAEVTSSVPPASGPADGRADDATTVVDFAPPGMQTPAPAAGEGTRPLLAAPSTTRLLDEPTRALSTRAPSRTGARLLRLGAAAGALVVLALAAWTGLGERPSAANKAVSTSATNQSPYQDVMRHPEVPTPSGRVADVPPSPAADVAPPRRNEDARAHPAETVAAHHAPDVPAPSGADARSAPAEVPKSSASMPKAANQRHGLAHLSVSAVPCGKVFVDGRPIGEAPQRMLRVAAGRHRVAVEHTMTGRRQSETVLLTPGEQRLIVFRFE